MSATQISSRVGSDFGGEEAGTVMRPMLAHDPEKWSAVSEKIMPQHHLLLDLLHRLRLRCAAMPMVLRRPMSWKWASRKRRVARWPSLRSISKYSYSVLSVPRVPKPSRPILHHDAVQLEPAELAATHPARQPSLVDQPVDKGDPRNSESSDALKLISFTRLTDLARARRHLAPLARIDLDDQHVLGGGRAQERNAPGCRYSHRPNRVRRRSRLRGTAAAGRPRPSQPPA